jgi:CHAT domain-containing protein
LIEPFLPRLEKAKRLLVLRDGFFHLVPWEIFPLKPVILPETPDSSFGFVDPASFLGAEFDVSYLYSVSSAVSERRTAELNPEKNVIVVAPGYDPEDPGILPDAVREAEFVANLHGRIRSVLIAGNDATPEAFIRPVGGADMIHFAAHGVSVDDSPYDSGILMSGKGRILTVHDISSTPISPELVFLGACSTATGRSTLSEGVIGITRAFLKAGARNVVSTLWGVEDRSAFRLVKVFYKRLLEGDDSVTALAEARRMTAHGTISTTAGDISMAHPFFWAGFIHTGTGYRIND